MEAISEGRSLVLRINGNETLQFPLGELLDKLSHGSSDNYQMSIADMTLTIENEKARANLIFTNLQGEDEKKGRKISSAQGRLLLHLKP